jgi:hypothetical protein
MFKVGDRVRHTYGCQDETVKAVGMVGSVAVLTTEEEDEFYRAADYTLVKPVFPHSGARVRRKDGSEAAATIQPVGFNQLWYIDFDEGGRIEVPESYLLAHYEEKPAFPCVGARFKRRRPSGRHTAGVVTGLDGGNVQFRFDDGWEDNEVGFSRRYFTNSFEEE